MKPLYSERVGVDVTVTRRSTTTLARGDRAVLLTERQSEGIGAGQSAQERSVRKAPSIS